MAVRFYDEALVNKIQKWIKDPNMRILKPNETSRLFQMRADQKDDQPLTLPLIAISRDPAINISVPSKRSLSFDGYIMNKTQKNTIELNAIPIELNYQIDIYTKHYDEGDEYMRNFVFNLVNYPQMKIELPYHDAKVEHICYVRLEPNVVDNSDIAEKLFYDEFTRWTLSIRIDDAYLFSIPIKENIQIIGADVYVEDKQAKEIEYEGGYRFKK